MSESEDRVNQHAAELLRLTMKATEQGPHPLPEDELATLGKMIALERQLLIDAMSGLVGEDEPEAAAQPRRGGVRCRLRVRTGLRPGHRRREDRGRPRAARPGPEVRQERRQ